MSEIDGVILNEILENTKLVKKVVVDDVVEKQQKKKEQSSQRKAESKFKNVGAKFNESEQAEIKSRLDDLSVNQSQYIKKLIQDDLRTKTDSSEEVVVLNETIAPNDNYEALEATSKRVIELEKEQEEKNNLIVDYLKQKDTYKNRVKSFNELSLFEKIKYVIKGKKV